MKTLTRILTSALLGLCMTGSALAEIDAPSAQSLMQACGLWNQLGTVGASVKAGMEDALGKLTPAPSATETRRITRLTEEVLSATRLRTMAQAVIAQETDPTDVRALLTWYRSPVGIRIRKQEEAASAPDSQLMQSLGQYRSLLPQLPAPRQKLLRELARVTHAGEAMADTSINTLVAMQLGVLSSLPKATPPDLQAIRNAFQQQRPQLVKAMEEIAVILNVGMYQSVSDADLSRYVRFLQSPAGLRYNDITLHALNAALVSAAADLGQALLLRNEATPI